MRQRPSASCKWPRCNGLVSETRETLADLKRLPISYPLARSWWTVSVVRDRKSTRLNSSHVSISYAVFCLKKKKESAYNQCDVPILQSNEPPTTHIPDD